MKYFYALKRTLYKYNLRLKFSKKQNLILPSKVNFLFTSFFNLRKTKVPTTLSKISKKN